jgi:hypothetical protein
MSDGENVPRYADERAMPEAYAKCAREHPSLPAWTDLPLEMREDFHSGLLGGPTLRGARPGPAAVSATTQQSARRGHRTAALL